MPDDEILDQEVAEQPDPDAMAGFDVGAKDEDKPPDGEKPPENKKDVKPKEDEPPTGDEKPPEKKEEKPKEGEKPPEEKPPEDLTAQERIDRRVKELELPPQGDEPPKKEEQPPEHPAKEAEGDDRSPPPKEPPPASTPGRLTKEQIAEHLNAIPDDSLPEETVIIGDMEINLREFAEDDPERFAAVKVLSSVIAQQAIDKALKGQKPDEGIQQRLDEQDAAIYAFQWWDAVAEVHSDGKKIKSDPEFQKWYNGQPENVKRFGAPEATPDDAILLLDFYKEDIAKKGVKKHDDTARDKKKHTDDLHKGTMRTKNDTSTQGDTDMGDAEAGFEEGLKE